MELFIENFYLFLSSVILISFSGVLLPGPLFAATLEKAAKSKSAGFLIAIGHGIVEFPIMFLIYYWLNQFLIPDIVPITVGLAGGLLMIFMGLKTFKDRNKPEKRYQISKQESVLAGIWTTAANAGFIIWWLTIGTTLILNAKEFGLIGFSIFTIVHWSCDFLWYTLVSFLIFKSKRFWTERVHTAILIFCFAVFVGFGTLFFSSALWSAIIALS